MTELVLKETRGAVALLAAMPAWALGTMVAGGLWLFLWTRRARFLGLVPILMGAAAFARIAAHRPETSQAGCHQLPKTIISLLLTRFDWIRATRLRMPKSLNYQ